MIFNVIVVPQVMENRSYVVLETAQYYCTGALSLAVPQSTQVYENEA